MGCPAPDHITDCVAERLAYDKPDYFSDDKPKYFSDDLVADNC